jgi:hypothetical protein
MLAVNKYSQEYIDDCRSKMAAQIAAYKKVSANAKSTAIDAFEPLFLNHMVIVLDAYFVHRTRALELKDGNPLNEVRLLCSSIIENDARLVADKQIKLRPETSVLKYEVGDEIRVNVKDFTRLSDAFFAEIEAKFS